MSRRKLITMELLEFTDQFIGTQESMNWWQIMVRATLVFIVMVIYVRIGGERAFAQWSAFDIVLSIIIGSVLSRAITGNAPFFLTLLAGLTIMVLHRLISLLAYRWDVVGFVMKGRKVCLYKDGEVQEDAFRLKHISKRDFEEAMRLKGYDRLDSIKVAYLERNGNISFIS